MKKHKHGMQLIIQQVYHIMNKYVQVGYVSRDLSPIIRSDGWRSISRNIAHLNILVHEMINLLYYEY